MWMNYMALDLYVCWCHSPPQKGLVHLALSKSRWTVSMGHSTISTHVAAIKCIADVNFVYYKNNALVHGVYNTCQMLQRETHELMSSGQWPPTYQSWIHWLRDLGSLIAAWVWVVLQQHWRNHIGTGKTLIQHLSEKYKTPMFAR